MARNGTTDNTLRESDTATLTRVGGRQAPRTVTVIGHSSQVFPTVAFFVGGEVPVRIVTADQGAEETYAPYPGVSVFTVAAGYEAAPEGLGEGPFVLCVDQVELANRIRTWLPPTMAIFRVGREHRSRGRVRNDGFLTLGEATAQLRRNVLRRFDTLRRVDRLVAMARGKRTAVVLLYQDPDPDAIGAALGLAAILRLGDCEVDIRYTGQVKRYQNKLLLSWLKYDIKPLDEGELDRADLVAVVDAQPGFWRNDPPRADIILDHHPRRDDTEAAFVDLRENYGSTSTILIEYLHEAGVRMNRKLATALVYGLMTDTADLSRQTSSADIRAFDIVHQKADHFFLARLNKSVIPSDMLDQIAWGVTHRLVWRELLLIHFGLIDNPDLLVQSADTLLQTCGITWTVCAGVVGDRLVVVFRSDGHRMDVGARAKAAFARIGSAGGHRTMARAEIPLQGEHVDVSVEILVDNLFRRLNDNQRARMIRALRSHLHSAGPSVTRRFEA